LRTGVTSSRGMHKRRFRVKWKNVALTVSIGMLLTSGIAVHNFYRLLHNFQAPESREFGMSVPAPGQRINLLILGLDLPIDPVTGMVVVDADFRQARFWSRSDTVIVVSVDPETHDVAVLSIPRDTRVKIAWEAKGYEKIAHAHAYGGPRMAVRTVENFLGVPIHYYLRTDPRGFAAMVDVLGGVKLDVEKDMFYQDPYQGLYIDLKQGLQVLDGERAMQYTRYRQDSDLDRVMRQQKFLQALRDELFQFGTILKLPKLASELARYVDTNLAPDQILSYALLAARVSVVELTMAALPGHERWLGGVCYWEPDLPAVRTLVDRLMWGIVPEKNAEVRVEVLNGTDNEGLAGRMAASLREQGFNVVRIANAPGTGIRTTQVINLADDAEKHRLVVRAMRRDLSELNLLRVNAVDEQADVRVIVGQDYFDRADPR